MSMQNAMTTSYNFDWSVIGENMGPLLRGLVITVGVTTVGMLLAVILALPVTALRMMTNPLARVLSSVYIEVMRGVPVFVALFLIYYGLASEFAISLTPFVSASIALGLTGSGYMVEVYRSGLTSIDSGQREAGAALGLSRMTVSRAIVLPQVVPIIIAPTVSVLVGLLKGATFVSVIGVMDMFYVASVVSVDEFKPFELYTVAALLMIAITIVLATAAGLLERRFGRGAR